jgi:hypothetical protein
MYLTSKKTKIMKSINFLVFATIFAISIFSCKKNASEPTPVPPKNYSEITNAHLQSKDAAMAATIIPASNGSGLIMKTGDVFVYKTSNGLYGKFEIVAIDIPTNYKLTINAVTYNADGSVKTTNNGLIINGTFLCDLDLLTEGLDNTTSDFKWSRVTATETNLEPKNAAKFYKYIF